MQTPDWTLVAKEAALPGAADVQETRWSATRAPGGAYDGIGLHRYRKQGPQAAALLYLPGTNMNGAAALTDEDHNLLHWDGRRLDLEQRLFGADKSGSQDVTLNVLERYGHLDVIVGERARAVVFEPTQSWIVSRAGGRQGEGR